MRRAMNHARLPWTRTIPILSVVACTLALGTISCGRGSDSTHSFTLEDSSGVVIATSAGGAWKPGEAWSLSEQPSVVLGGSDVGAELLQVYSYARAPDRSVAVLSSGLREVRVFDAEGHSSLLVGRTGQGPGEFTMPMSLALAEPDTLLVLDQDAIEIFLLDGTWLESLPMRPVPNPFGPGTFARPMSVAPDRSVLAQVMRYAPGRSTPVGVYRPDMGYAVVPAPEHAPVLLGWYGGIEQQRIDAGGGTRQIVAPFARSSVHGVGVSSEERFLTADNARYEIHAFDARGMLRRIVRREHEPVPVQDQWIEDWKDAQREMDWTRNQLPQLERGWAQMTVNETLPAFERFTVDALGYLWVLRPSGEQGMERTYEIFNRDGRLLGEVRTPSGMRRTPQPLIGDDYFMGVWTDELNVESVRIYELRGRR